MAGTGADAKGAVIGAGAAPDPAAKASPYAWYALGILFLVYVLNFIDRQIITILAPDLKRDLGLDDADIGFLYGTAFAVFYALFGVRSEEHTSELQSLMRISYAVFCLKKKKTPKLCQIHSTHPLTQVQKQDK